MVLVVSAYGRGHLLGPVRAVKVAVKVSPIKGGATITAILGGKASFFLATTIVTTSAHFINRPLGKTKL